MLIRCLPAGKPLNGTPKCKQSVTRSWTPMNAATPLAESWTWPRSFKCATRQNVCHHNVTIFACVHNHRLLIQYSYCTKSENKLLSISNIYVFFENITVKANEVMLIVCYVPTHHRSCVNEMCRQPASVVQIVIKHVVSCKWVIFRELWNNYNSRYVEHFL